MVRAEFVTARRIVIISLVCRLFRIVMRSVYHLCRVLLSICLSVRLSDRPSSTMRGLIKFGFPRQIFVKISNTKFHKIPFSGSRAGIG